MLPMELVKLSFNGTRQWQREDIGLGNIVDVIFSYTNEVPDLPLKPASAGRPLYAVATTVPRRPLTHLPTPSDSEMKGDIS
jgi:hypothetical protein